MKKTLIFLLILLSTNSYAESGNYLYEIGKKRETNSIIEAHYSGYINGAIQSYIIHNENLCFSEDILDGQIYDVVFLYLKNHPEKRNENASKLVVNAIKETWPCK